MSFLRPEAVAALARWREPAAAGLAAAGALWMMSLGGYFFVPLGGAALALAAGWGVVALRRMRFRQVSVAPGLVDVDEGQVGYLGPAFGGFASLDEIDELRLLTLNGQRLWRLRLSDGQVLMIPVAAEGSERLFDAFARLPGLSSQSLVAALEDGAAVISLSSEAARIGPVIWRRSARAVLT